ncbi:hypothetical protein QYM36_000732 [Artemia franciscana]|uniref:Uncharacterized protein n=1 Tax=Artemia franciscana TaxID=6661 RepID=A0AA88IDQ6_ARTSF|nr:hypothetical protein QYM36_000732 [Artemia franciscana]
MGLGTNLAKLDNTDDIETFTADLVTAQATLNEIALFSQLLGMNISIARAKDIDLNIRSDYQPVFYG